MTIPDYGDTGTHTSSGHAFQRDQKILAALELADRILERDGLQELRGLAWHDGERWAIREAIEMARGSYGN